MSFNYDCVDQVEDLINKLVERLGSDTNIGGKVFVTDVQTVEI